MFLMSPSYLALFTALPLNSFRYCSIVSFSSRYVSCRAIRFLVAAGVYCSGLQICSMDRHFDNGHIRTSCLPCMLKCLVESRRGFLLSGMTGSVMNKTFRRGVMRLWGRRQCRRGMCRSVILPDGHIRVLYRGRAHRGRTCCRL